MIAALQHRRVCVAVALAIGERARREEFLYVFD